MTLIIYLRCKDGCVLISDRQASEDSGHRQEDRKTFLSNSKDFVIGGAGTGFNVIQIFYLLSQDDTVDGSNIVERIGELLNSYRERFSSADARVIALLVTKENNRLIPYEIKIRGDQFFVNRLSVRYRSCGISAARILADYFLSKRKLDEVPWLEAVQYAIAIMKEVGEQVNGVGRLEDFGLDITVMLDDGTVKEWANCKESSANFSVDLRILKDISAEFNRIATTPSEGN